MLVEKLLIPSLAAELLVTSAWSHPHVGILSRKLFLAILEILQQCLVQD